MQIPGEERHGSAKDLFWLWFGSDLTFTYVAGDRRRGRRRPHLLGTGRP